jgi:hypothetical protein
MQPKTKAELLAKYETRSPKAFYQYDGWAGVEWNDGIIDGDNDGHAITWPPEVEGRTWELMEGSSAVRVLIPLDTTPADAVALLRKIADRIAANSRAG